MRELWDFVVGFGGVLLLIPSVHSGATLRQSDRARPAVVVTPEFHSNRFGDGSRIHRHSRRLEAEITLRVERGQ